MSSATLNHRLESLQPYPFERLKALKDNAPYQGKADAIALSVGEPAHEPPAIVLDALKANLDLVSNYPLTRGDKPLRETLAAWLSRRFSLHSGKLSAERHVLPVNGTREALFAIAQTLIPESAKDGSLKPALVLIPNPFYQIYEGAALMAGAEIGFMPCTAANGFQPDLSALDTEQLDRCALMYLCTPGNPSGQVLSKEYLKEAIRLARKHQFTLISDECYSELYADEDNPPCGLLQAAEALTPGNYDNCLVFHSLSKRSNLPGLRSGLVAGDERLVAAFLKYRTYHGSAMSRLFQQASIVAWSDEAHVIENRRLYREKFQKVTPLLSKLAPLSIPPAGFYLWLPVEHLVPAESERSSDEVFARELFARENVTVLPGSYLSRERDGQVPGRGYVRIALVATLARCLEASERILHFCEGIKADA